MSKINNNVGYKPSNFILDEHIEDSESALEYIKRKILKKGNVKTNDYLNFTNPVNNYQAMKEKDVADISSLLAKKDQDGNKLYQNK